MIVIDASVLVDVLIRAKGVDELEARIFGDASWNSPHLVDLEVAQVLRRWVLGDRIGDSDATRAFALLPDLPLRRWPHRPLLPRVWALRKGLTAYDAAYVALAEALDCDLVTRDAQLARSRGHRARLVLV